MSTKSKLPMATPDPLDLNRDTLNLRTGEILTRQRPRVQVQFTKPSKTDESFADECNINKIIAKVISGIPVSHVNPRQAFYEDVNDVPDYQTAQTMIANADQAFMALPALTRAEFHNDPQEFIEFCGDPENGPKLLDMGLATATALNTPVSSENNPQTTPPGGGEHTPTTEDK